jgi:hypothetical protein
MRRLPLFFAVALVPALAQLGCFVVALVLRARYPMDLEWMEGPQLYEAFRFVHGLPVYESPVHGFVACPYPPLFHVVAGAIGCCFGFDYWNGRVVSDVSIAVAIVVQTLAVLRAAPSRRSGWLLATMGAGAVAASYRPLEASMDLARVDTMGFALVAVAACFARRPVLGWARAAALGALLCAAVFTKQTNVFYAAWIAGYVAWRDRRGAACATVVAAGGAVVALCELQRCSEGWFWTWLVEMRHHGLVPARCLLAALVVAACASLVGRLLADFRRRGWLGEPTRFWCGMLAASVPACVGPWLSPGGWVNNLIGLVLTAILFALLLLCDALRGMGPGGAAERWIVAALSALLLGALYDPMRNVPDATRVRDAEALHALVRSLDGDVLVPMYPFVVPRDGKTTPQMSLVAYEDTVGPGRLNADAAAAIRSKQPKWVVLCGHEQEEGVPGWLGPAYEREVLDLRVQALQETTGRPVTVLRRVSE